MKKMILAMALVFCAVGTNYAQKGKKPVTNSTQNAIGLRFGGNSGLGTEVSYQRDLNKANRLEIDLGWRNHNNYDAVKVTGLYQWKWNIDGNFNWYAGPGAAVGTYNYKYYDGHGKKYSDNGTFGLLTGVVGIEYTFDIPIQVALDVRPEIYLNDSYRDGVYADFGIAVRYKF
ncbi:MAG: hypothetical protein LBI72_05070 [Flavobacteriaceae bacterium]|jgi:hypothetical protein|nr:hypothetical protein [Flavobacteriaceae bacterium]